MKHVVKEQWMGCAVASAAMLADLTYEDIAARTPALDAARLRWPHELCALLGGVTGARWRYTACWSPRPELCRFAAPLWPVAAFVQDAPSRPRLGQWVVIHGEIVHDPESRSAQHMSRYPRRNWRIAWVAQPVRPAEFAECQAQRHLEKLRTVLSVEGVGSA
jgi:hypothetical protein